LIWRPRHKQTTARHIGRITHLMNYTC